MAAVSARPSATAASAACGVTCGAMTSRYRGVPSLASRKWRSGAANPDCDSGVVKAIRPPKVSSRERCALCAATTNSLQ